MDVRTYLSSVLLAKLDDAGVDDGIDVRGIVGALLRVVFAGEPLLDVEVVRAVQLDGVAVEEVGHQDEVAVGGQLVGDELDVDELVADDIGDAVLALVSPSCSRARRRAGWLTSRWHSRWARQRYRSQSRQVGISCLAVFLHV